MGQIAITLHFFTPNRTWSLNYSVLVIYTESNKGDHVGEVQINYISMRTSVAFNDLQLDGETCILKIHTTPHLLKYYN
jgi:hypothetical protein